MITAGNGTSKGLQETLTTISNALFISLKIYLELAKCNFWVVINVLFLYFLYPEVFHNLKTES